MVKGNPVLCSQHKKIEKYTKPITGDTAAARDQGVKGNSPSVPMGSVLAAIQDSRPSPKNKCRESHLEVSQIQQEPRNIVDPITLVKGCIFMGSETEDTLQALKGTMSSSSSTILCLEEGMEDVEGQA
ncbi:hypothetical protein NDU88_000458 [Pleurodeles waltl]|uniref:Uncharacterized protein n=1 Tax=Pleurodeles waltl TaxID=8319 RepID=A0AAV7TF67_PLEWA|nr:hypothetical protein NDU88_000458 [Pleurodeles waltl]